MRDRRSRLASVGITRQHVVRDVDPLGVRDSHDAGGRALRSSFRLNRSENRSVGCQRTSARSSELSWPPSENGAARLGMNPSF